MSAGVIMASPVISYADARLQGLFVLQVFLHGKIVDPRVVFLLCVGHVMAGSNIWLDNMYFVKRRDDQQLQVKLFEKLHGVAGVHLIRTHEGFIDDHKTKGAAALLLLIEAILIGNGGGKDGVGKLRLLAAGLARRVIVVIFGGVVFAIAFFCREIEPVAHIGHFGRPAFFLLETLDQGLNAAEAGLVGLGT